MQLSPLAVLALGLLTERPMHPYEMFQQLIARQEDTRVKIKPGTLYHTVDRLKETGLARSAGTERSGNRPERTVYEITAAGRDALRAWLRDAVAVPRNEYPAIRVAIAEMHNLPAAEAVALVERRLAVLDGDLAEVEAAIADTGARDVEERFVLDLDYERAVLRTERDWFAALADRIRGGALAWPGADAPAMNTEGGAS